MIAALQPPTLNEASLEAALTRMAENFGATGDIHVEVESEGEVQQLPMKVEAALLRRRIADAAAAGADLVFSGAAPLSTSHRNMERAGMRIQFVRSLWITAA